MALLGFLLVFFPQLALIALAFAWPKRKAETALSFLASLDREISWQKRLETDRAKGRIVTT